MKKLFALLLALCLMGCTAALAEEPVVITLGRSVSTTAEYMEGDTIDDNFWTRNYLDTSNIQLVNDWTVADSEYESKLNLCIASGTIPDVLRLSTKTQVNALHEAELIADLTDVYEKYASDTTKAIMSGDGGDALKACEVDGRLYAIPYMNATIYDMSLLWLRQDWLDKLGLSMPTTMDELVKVLYAFTFDDPDGNGENDTYGLAVTDELFSIAVGVNGLFNGFGAYPAIWHDDGNGNYVYGSTQPAMKQGLELLAKLYKDGVIDPDFALKDVTKVCENIQGFKFGAMFGADYAGYFCGTPQDKWTIAGAVSATGDEVKYSVSSSIINYWVVSAACEHPEAAVELMNIFCDCVYGDRRGDSLYGVDGIWLNGTGSGNCCWIRTSTPNSLTIDAIKNVVKSVDARDPSFLKDAVTETDKYEPAVKWLDEGDTAEYARYYQYEAFKINAAEVGKDCSRLVQNKFVDSTPTMDEVWTILKDYELEMFTKIIMGNLTIDAFDEFVTNWNSMGGQAVTEEINAILK